jgi:predicted transcriptional regulator|tara:strand:- start:185 stop:409 length:225 start_codon:yes stop_codon:yes gene_type:complete
MTDMFGDYDPYLELEFLKQTVETHNSIINKLVKANNEQAKTLQDISEEFVKITKQNLYLHNTLNKLLEQLNETK